MTRNEFESQILRLKETYGDKSYPSERVKIFWDKLKYLSYDPFSKVVSKLIAFEKFAPMFDTFQEELRMYLNSGINGSSDIRIKDQQRNIDKQTCDRDRNAKLAVELAKKIEITPDLLELYIHKYVEVVAGKAIGEQYRNYSKNKELDCQFIDHGFLEYARKLALSDLYKNKMNSKAAINYALDRHEKYIEDEKRKFREISIQF